MLLFVWQPISTLLLALVCSRLAFPMFCHSHWAAVCLSSPKNNCIHLQTFKDFFSAQIQNSPLVLTAHQGSTGIYIVNLCQTFSLDCQVLPQVLGRPLREADSPPYFLILMKGKHLQSLQRIFGLFFFLKLLNQSINFINSPFEILFITVPLSFLLPHGC